jgi:hypothetical protein
MANHGDICQRVLEIIVRSRGCDLEEVVLECRDLTWNQVFLELDRLSRAGRITLKQIGRGHYMVAPVTRTKPAATTTH